MSTFRDAIAAILFDPAHDDDLDAYRRTADAVLAMREMEALRNAVAAMAHTLWLTNNNPPCVRDDRATLAAYQLSEHLVAWVLGEDQ